MSGYLRSGRREDRRKPDVHVTAAPPQLSTEVIEDKLWDASVQLARLPYVQREAIARSLRNRMLRPEREHYGHNDGLFRNFIVGMSEVIK